MVEVLFSLGDWKIKRDTEYPHLKDRDFAYYATHNCTEPSAAYYELSWFISDDEEGKLSTCYHCDKAVPDEVQGLLRLLVSF